jgi:hypothetical protein
MTEDELSKSVLKVLSPYEGTAFVAAPKVAVSCVHVCVEDGKNPMDRHEVQFEYLPSGSNTPVRFYGYY